MLRRPNKEDTEEDLLRLQQEFLASKSSPAATIVRKTDSCKRKPGDGDHEPSDSSSQCSRSLKEKTNLKKDVVSLGELPSQFAYTSPSAAPPVKKSKFRERRMIDQILHDDPEEALEKHDTHISKVLSEIVERDIDSMPVCYPGTPATQGFPAVLHRGTLQTTGKTKDKSLFAQQFASSSAQQFGIAVADNSVKSVDRPQHKEEMMEVSNSAVDEDPATDDYMRIDEENKAKLAAMSPDEILSEQKKLLEMLDPGLVSFLKHRSKTGKISGKKAAASSEKMEKVKTKHEQDNTKVNKDLHADLPVKVDDSWVNMDKVEADKLRWMEDLPPPPGANDMKTGVPARFDFSGSIVMSDATLPTHLGLHHHGEEPERAGYTLQELFQLARSANMQQRVIALNIMAKILKNSRQGDFHDVISVPLTPALVDGGLLFIVRWALDDSTENSMAAAVDCLHALLVSPLDEVGVDRVFSWYQGMVLPSLCPMKMEDPTDDAEEKLEETDADILKRDVIAGLQRMFLLPRLRYILDKWRPAACVVIQILEILIRMARHSTQMAYEIMQCSSLIDIIVTNFLPTTWTPVEETADKLENVYGYPVPQAMKLVRVLCSSGRHIAASLISKYNMMTIIMRYITEDSSALQLLAGEADLLKQESLRTWQVVLTYGLTSQQLSDMYPVIIKMLQLLSSVSHNNPTSIHPWATGFLGLLEAMVYTAASVRDMTIQHTSRTYDITEGVKSEVIPSVNWSHVKGLIGPVELILQKSLSEFCRFHQSKKFDTSFLASILNFIAGYYMKLEGQPGYSAVETMDHIDTLCDKLLPCLNSQAFRTACQSIRIHSLLLHPKPITRSDALKCLPDFGALIGSPVLKCPLLDEVCSIQFVLAMTRLLYVLGKLSKPAAEKLYTTVLQSEDLVLYVRKCCLLGKPSSSSNAFTKFENLLLYYLISMAKTKAVDCDYQLYHMLSLRLLTQLNPGDEHLAHDLLSTVIFNQDLIRLEDASLNSLANLNLEEDVSISSATQKEVRIAHEELIKDTVSNLPRMRNTYLTSVSHLSSQLHKSRAMYLHLPQEIDKVQVGEGEHGLVPLDWVFLPVVTLHNNAADIHHTHKEENVSPAVIATVRQVLRVVFLLELYRPGILDLVKLSTKLSRLMCIFLAGSDLFLDSYVHAYLASLLRIYCRPVNLDRLDFNQPIPGLGAFYDFYMTLIAQYEAVSFGDSLFGSFILLPMQQSHSIHLRKAVWGEHCTVLRALRIPIKEVPVPLESFLMPEETNLEILRLLFQALLSESVRPAWCPLPYLCAVHHVSRYFYTSDGKHSKLRQSIVNQVVLCKNKILQHHLLYYKKANPECEYGLELYTSLPSNRQKLVDLVKSKIPP